MTDERLISRRKLLTVASVAPLSALLIRCNATHEEVAAVAKKLPDTSTNELWRQLKNEPGAKEDKFKDAVKILYEYFSAGSDDNGVEVPDSGQPHIDFVFDVAFNQQNKSHQKSAVLIARRSGNWDNYLHRSVVCAYHCGAYFAEGNPKWSDKESVRSAYNAAYKRVEDSMTLLLARAISIGKFTPVEAKGAGC